MVPCKVQVGGESIHYDFKVGIYGVLFDNALDIFCEQHCKKNRSQPSYRYNDSCAIILLKKNCTLCRATVVLDRIVVS